MNWVTLSSHRLLLRHTHWNCSFPGVPS